MGRGLRDFNPLNSCNPRLILVATIIAMVNHTTKMVFGHRDPWVLALVSVKGCG